MKRHERLRFGIMCTGSTFPAWEARCIEALLDLDGAEPALLIVEDEPRSADGGDGSTVLRHRARIGRLLHGDVSWWEWYERFFARPRSSALEPVDLTEKLAGVARIRCRTQREGRYSESFSADAIQSIRSYRLDFILRFAFGILRGEILEAATFGVWSYHHGDPTAYRGGPPCFWEVYDGSPVTGAVLQRLTERLDGGVILFRGFLSTVADSHVKNRDRLYWTSAGWVARAVREIQLGRLDHVGAAPVETDAPIYRAPDNGEMVRFLWRVFGRYVKQKWEEIFQHEQWSVGVYHGRIETFMDDDDRLRKLTWLPVPSRDRYLADPFCVHGDDGLTVLVEEFDYRTERGGISWLRLRDGTVAAGPAPALELEAHASYPFVFRERGELYCVPETAGLRQVRLFRAVDFPGEWELEAVLVVGTGCLDPTVFRWEGRWWLAATTLEDGMNNSLHLWYAEELTGRWTPHPLNPVKVDVRSSRPAGTPFRLRGALYRPAQDCAGRYGHAVSINRITELNPTAFCEKTVAVIRPDPGGRFSDGLHTLSFDGDHVIVDGRRRGFVPAKLLHRIRDSVMRWTSGGVDGVEASW